MIESGVATQTVGQQARGRLAEGEGAGGVEDARAWFRQRSLFGARARTCSLAF